MGSLCHSWSAGGAIYSHRYVLGLRQLSNGQPDHWTIEPRATERFSFASGWAHGLGQIRVSWKRSGGLYEVKVEAPEGVVVEAGDHVVLRCLVQV